MAMMVDEAVMAERDFGADGGAASTLGVRVTPEALLYTLLALVAIALRFAALGDAPLNDDEARRALGALRMVNGSVPGEVSVPDSPLTLALHALTFTFGGVRVNSQAQVLSTRWQVIRGLYACGEMVGGLFHINYPGGSGLMSGAVFGRIAGAAAAGQ